MKSLSLREASISRRVWACSVLYEVKKTQSPETPIPERARS
jgi:hypothetical protein